MMHNYDESMYGERISEVYDQLYSGFDPACIDTLAELAQGGPALELGIGTGRIALPLKERGVTVLGIDASPGMVEQLRAKPGGQEIPVTLGDFGQVAVERQFSLIYVVFNTFFALLTQEAQIECFRNVARHLRPEGLFVLEVFVPDLARFINHQTVRAVSLDENRIQLDASRQDPVSQTIISQHIFLSEAGLRLYPVKLRYAWPSELDLMARLVGLALRERWGDWDRRPFTADSGRHVSVYGQKGE